MWQKNESKTEEEERTNSLSKEKNVVAAKYNNRRGCSEIKNNSYSLRVCVLLYKYNEKVNKKTK